MTLENGRKLGPYEILSPLGAGGMGEVYRAKDTSLGREVAIKVLPADVASSSERLQRFEREAKTVATLNHPNIVTIHGIHNEDGHRFIAMELVEGETLDRMIAPGGLPLAKIFDIAIPLADALAAAHGKGIVHRDLKPANVMVTKEGRVKVLDFGLAKLTAAGPGGSSPDDVTISAPLTGRGVIMGTVPYMSPEQLQGESLDHRTDLFSLGIMLYEMSTGQRPFRGKNSATVTSSILRDTPRPLHELNNVLPRHLGRIIEHCLEKDLEQRFQSAKDIRNELRALRKEVDSGSDFSESQSVSVQTPVAPPPSSTASAIPSGSALSAPTRRGEFWVGIVVLAVVVMVAALWIGRSGSTTEPTVTPAPGRLSSIRSIAVIPFVSVGGDKAQDYFVDGITGAITDDLAKISALKVTNTRTMMRYHDSNSTLPEIARELSVDAFVTGDALQVGDRIQIRVRLVEATTQRQIWSDHFERDKRDILKIYNDVARAVAEEVKIELTSSEEKRLTSAPKVNPNAYDIYARGQELVRRGTRRSCREAIGLFDAAVDIDNGFALALAAKANAYFILSSTHLAPSETMPQMAESARAALALDEGLVEAHIALAQYLMQYEWDWSGAESHLTRAVELNPSHGVARLNYAAWLAAMDRKDEALVQLNLSVELDPAVKYTIEQYGGVALMLRQYERCVRDAMGTLKVDADNGPAHQWGGLAQSQLGNHEDAIHHLRRAVALSGDSPQVRAMLGGVLAVAKHADEARAIRKRLKQRKDIEYVCPYEVATISIGLEEYDQAFDEMSEACDDRAECVPWLQVDPRLDPIRDDIRFDRLLERVGFEPPQRMPLAADAGRRLAVLPLENLSHDPKQEYFSDGMTDALISDLGKIAALRVTSRTSSMRYKDSGESLAEIVKALDVDVILEGSVLRIDDRVRITVQLVEAASERILWGESYERDGQDIIGMQREVARAVAEQIQLELTPDESTRLAPTHLVNTDAYELYLQGRGRIFKGTVEDVRAGLALIEQALEIDPEFALAHAGRAEGYMSLVSYDLAPKEIMPRAKAAALKALELDETSAEAHAALGTVYLQYDWDWDAAEGEFRRALELKRTLPEAHLGHAKYLVVMGRTDEAMIELAIAYEYDPYSVAHSEDYFFVAFLSRRFDKVLEYAQRALGIDPDSWVAHVWLGQALAQLGEFDEAVAEAEAGERLNPNSVTTANLGVVYALAGMQEESGEVLRKLGEIGKVSYVCAYRLALIHVNLHDYDTAFEYLSQACYDRSDCMPFLNADVRLDPLRDDPRFREAQKCVGLEPEPTLTLLDHAAPPNRIKLAVVPFENVSSDPNTDYLSHEIPASIIDTMSGLSGLSVISRSGAFRFDPAKEDASSFGKSLGASVVLAGQLNAREDYLIIRAELVDVNTNQQLWSKRYARELTDIMAIETNITQSISQALRLQLTPEERTDLAKDDTKDADAYRALLEGRFWFQRFTLAGWRKALGHFQDAVRIDPAYALAHAELSKAYCALGVWFGDMPPDEAGPKAKQAAATAIALDDTLGEAHGALALNRLFYDWDWSGAEEAFLRSISLAPKSGEVHLHYAILLRITGRFRESEETLKVAQQLDPTFPMNFSDLGATYACMDRYEDGIEQCKKALVLDPEFPPAYQTLGHIYSARRMYDEAISHFEKNSALRNRKAEDLGSLGSAYALAGQRAKALAVLNELRGVSSKGRGQVPAAQIHASLGNLDAAFASLEQAFVQRDPGLLWLNLNVQFVPLRGDPRYVDLAQRMGFEPVGGGLRDTED